MNEQDPDGDQIILAYDLCPCVPEVLAKNALDADNDRVGDTCDPEANDQRFAAIISGMPASDFATQGVRDDIGKGFVGVIEACRKQSTAKAQLLAGDLARQLDDLHARGELGSNATTMLTDEVKKLVSMFQHGAMACIDRPLPKAVTSCP